MQYCHNCKTEINGNKKCCPLCQGTLSGQPEPTKEAYPQPEPPRYDSSLLLKLVHFTAVAIIVISFAVNIMVPAEVWWSLFVAGGTLCAWITVSVSIIYRKKLFKNIAWQLFIITALAVLWDVFTGWHGWCLDYVIPCACAATTVSIIILSKTMKTPYSEYLIYLILSNVYGLVPGIFLLLGKLDIVYPSVICIAVSLISFFEMLIFEREKMKDEMTKKLHL